jgi:inorganic pyrophosphatase
MLKEIKDFFETYKRLQNKEVIVKDFKDITWAKTEYDHCVQLMKKYGKLSKDKFLAKMKQMHPEKYR